MARLPNEKTTFAPNKIQFAYFSLILAWAANILIYFITTNPELIMNTKEGLRLADFVGYYEAAKLSAAGANLYDFKTQLGGLNQIIAPAHGEIAWAIAYPPTFYWLLTPLSMLTLTNAFTVWKFFSVPVGLAGTYVLLASQQRFSKTDRAAILLSLIANTPALFAIRAGQFTFFLIALVSLYVWGLLKERHFVSGLCLGLLAAIKPHYAIFLVLPALTMRRWKLLITSAGSVLALLAACLARFGWHILPEYVHYLSDAYSCASYTGIFPGYQVNLRALIIYRWLHWTTPTVVAAFSSATLIVGLSLTFWVWIKSSRRPELFDWSMAFTITMLLLCGPHVHHYDCLLLAVAAILTIPSVSFAKVVQETNWSYRAWCFVLLLYPLVSFVTFSLSVFYPDLKLITILGSNIVLAITSLAYFIHLSQNKPAQWASTSALETTRSQTGTGRFGG